MTAVLAHAGGLLAGALAGALGSFVHAARLVGVPVGLPVALALAAGTFGAAGLAARSRTGAAAAGLGWVTTVLLATSPRPEGDLVVAGDVFGYLWLVGGLVVLGACLALPYADLSYARHRPPSATAPDGR